jgi:hypothetical protein
MVDTNSKHLLTNRKRGSMRGSSRREISTLQFQEVAHLLLQILCHNSIAEELHMGRVLLHLGKIQLHMDRALHTDKELHMDRELHKDRVMETKVDQLNTESNLR